MTRWRIKCFIIIITSSILMAQNGPDTLICTEVEVESMEEYQELLDFGCSLGCAIGWDFDATSTLESHGNNTYGPGNLEDGDQGTAWVEGAEGYGIGETITIIFDTPEEMENLNFDGIDFLNGYTKSATLWEYNSRVKTFKVWHNDDFLFCIRLLDTDWPQRVNFSPDHTIYLNPGDKVYLEIADVFEGRKYEDTAISEMNLYGAH